MLDSLHTWELTVAGTDRTSLVRPGSLAWTTREGRELDALTAILDDRAGVFGSSLAPFAEIILTVDPGEAGEAVVFGGYVTLTKPDPDPTGQWLAWEVNASGYEVLFDTTPRVYRTWVNETPGAILAALFTAAGLTPEFDVSTHVAAGSALEVFTAAGEKLTALLDALAAQAGMVWWCDAEQAVWLVAEDAAAAQAPFAVIQPGTLADHSADLYEIETGTLRVRTDATGLINRLRVVGGYAIDAATEDTFAGADAETVSIGLAFNLSSQNIRSSVTVSVNGTYKVLGTAFVDYFGKARSDGTVVQVLVSRINGVVYFPPATAFDPADVIVVGYQVASRQTLTLDASNSAASAASLALYGRYFDDDLDVAPVTDQAEMLAAGEAYLAQYAFGVQTGEFATLRLGLRAGQNVAITSARDGLSGRYVIRSCGNALLENGYVRSTVKFGGRPEKLGSYVGGGAGSGGSGGAEGPGGGGAGGNTPIQGDAGPLNLIDVLTALEPGTAWDPSDGGTATGLVLTPATVSAAGRLLGYDGGVLQAYLDSDGTIKWAGGKGKADNTGLEHVEDANNYLQIKPASLSVLLKIMSNQAGHAALDATNTATGSYAVKGTNTSGVDGVGVHGAGYAKGVSGVSSQGHGVYGEQTGGVTNMAGVYGKGNGSGTAGGRFYGWGGDAAVFEAAGTFPGYAIRIISGEVYGGNQRYTALADATAATDALNRQTGDARYCLVSTGYLTAAGTVAGSTSQAQDFGATGIKANVIAESGAAAGVTIDGLLLKDSAIPTLRLPTATELTISSGAVTATQSRHTLDTEGDAPSDDLDTISGGNDGQVLVLRSDAGRSVVVKHNTGNILLNGNADVTLDWTSDMLLLMYSSALTRWVQLSLSEARSYWLYDQFTTERSAGSVNGTACEPGPGTRTVTDTESKLTITGGQLSFSGGKASPANNDPYYRTEAVTRVAGLTWLMTINASSFGSQVFAGLDTSETYSFGHTLKMASWDFAARAGHSSTDVSVGSPLSTGTAYQIAVTLRASGAYYWIKGGAYTNWRLLWVDHACSTVTLYPGLRNYNGAFVADNFRIPTRLWLPTPLAYDTVTRASLGSTETTGPDAQSCTARTWSSAVGTIGVSSNNLICSALSGGIGIGTYDTGTADVLHRAAVTRASGTAGVVVRYADSSNYVYAIHNGTNAQLIKRVGGSETTLINAAATYSAGAHLTICCAGTKFRLFYNADMVGTEQTISDAGLASGTAQGVYYTDTDSTIDNVLTLALGTGNEYSALDSM